MADIEGLREAFKTAQQNWRRNKKDRTLKKAFKTAKRAFNDAQLEQIGLKNNEKKKKENVKKRVNDVVVYVGNLDSSVTEKQLQRLFSHCGYILNIKMATVNKSDKNSKAFAHVKIKRNRKSAEQDTAAQALALDGTELEGRTIKVQISDLKAKSKKSKKAKAVPEQSLTQKKKKNALKYLQEWKTNRIAWKFRKVSQAYLLAHCYDRTIIDKDQFKILLQYIQGLKGASMDRATKTAEKIVEDYETQENEGGKKKGKLKYKRAIRILSILA
ncbi:hypothetical protein AAMO2058_000290700 [Amorphochlora amoebiformis]